MSKFEQGHQAAQQELLDFFNNERKYQLDRLRTRTEYCFRTPIRSVEFYDLWNVLRFRALEMAQLDYDNETRAYVARAKTLGLCKCEENAE